MSAEIDRRAREIGPPPGAPDRRTQRRRASDVLKLDCPFCGNTTSAIFQCGPLLRAEAYGRRRQCAACGEDYPTIETIDVVRLARDLAKRGKTLADLATWPKP